MDEVLSVHAAAEKEHLQLTRTAHSQGMKVTKLRFTTPNSGRRSLWLMLYSFIESNNSRTSEDKMGGRASPC